MVQGLISKLADHKYEGLEKIVESRFLQKLKSRSDDLNKFKFSYEKSSVEEMAKDSYLIDQLLVKGVRFNRDENDNNHDYLYVDNQENEGLRFYLHKYFIGFHPYYMEVKNQEFYEKKIRVSGKDINP